MKDNIANLYRVEKKDQHIYEVVNRETKEVVYSRMIEGESKRVCDLLNLAYSTGYIDGHSDACSDFKDLLDTNKEVA